MKELLAAELAKLPEEKFLAAADFGAVDNMLKLKLTDDTEFEVSLAKLLKTYTGDDTSSATVNVAENGKISANIKASAVEGNALEKKTDGLYVKATPIADMVDGTSTNEYAAGAKLLYDVLSELAWKEVV